MDKTLREVSRQIRRRIDSKQTALENSVGLMGDGAGRLYTDATRLKVWVRFGDSQAVGVFNSRVPAENDLMVIVGYSAEQYEENGYKLYQVLSTYSSQPGGETGGILGGLSQHARRHEWLAPQGGQDVVYVHGRAVVPLNIYVTNPNSMSAQLMRGGIFDSDGIPIEIPYTTFDLTSYIPTDAGKAALVLFTINNSGSNVATAGADVDIEDLMPAGDRFLNCPAIPAGTAYIRGCVRVYYGQTKVQEARTNTDIIDMRYFNYRPPVDVPVGSGDFFWEIIGALAVVASAAEPLLITKATTITMVYFYLESLGLSGNTTIDIISEAASASILTAPLDLAFNDANGWVSVVPDITDFVEGDILTLNITGVAPGAAGLRVILQVDTDGGGSGGGGFTPSHFALPHLMPDSTIGFAFSAAGGLGNYLLSSGAQDDEAVWNISIAPGIYVFKLAEIRNVNRGIYKVFIDGVDVGDIDAYGSALETIYSITDIAIDSPDPVEVKLVMYDKNASSSAYYSAIFAAWLIKTGDV